MSLKEVYQTLRNLNNNDQILKEGPFACKQDNAWLGIGYYFWEDSLKPARYWGKKFHDNKYVICKALCDISDDNCFNFEGNVKHNEFFEEALKKIQQLGELKSTVTVPHVIRYLMDCGQFPFYASRAETSDAFDPNQYLTEDDFKEDVIFNIKINKPKTRLHIVFQICIYDLSKVNFREFKIVEVSD